jgi:Family of unknown function (DUF5677)
MNKEELREYFIKYSYCKNLIDSRYVLEIHLDFLFGLLDEHHPITPKNYMLRDGKIMLQMIAMKLLHLKQLCEGTNYKHKTKSFHLTGIIDPTTIGGIARNIFELVGTFNLIFKTTKTEDELKIVYNLWVISGLKYRQQFKEDNMPSDLEQKVIDEQKKILKYINEIENNPYYISLNSKEQEKINTRIKTKEFKIQFENQKVICLDWSDLHTTLNLETNTFDKMYKHLSLYTHASNVSVFQFGQFFTDGDYINSVNFHLNYILNLTSIFIADFTKVFPETLSIFQIENLQTQLLIDQRNSILRKHETISNILEKLN